MSSSNHGDQEKPVIKTENLDDALAASMESCRSVVAQWMKKAPAKGGSKKNKTFAGEDASSVLGRPPRLGVGAKIKSQKEQFSNSVFLNQKLAQTLTGKNTFATSQTSGSFMKIYTNQMSSKKTQLPPKAEQDSDEEESRTKSLGKRPAPNANAKLSQKKRR